MSPSFDSAAASANSRHPRWLIAIHWGSALLLLLVFTLILMREGLDGRALRKALLAGHRSVGIGLLTLTALRLLLRRRHGPLAQHSGHSPLQKRIASLVHGALYLALLSLPLLGWALASSHGDLHLLGGFALPPLVDADPDLADPLEQIHRWAGWSLAGLIGLHAAAALWHHFVVRDNVLGAMWPLARQRA